MLTQRSRYALRAMLFLSDVQPGHAPVPMTRIAAEANVPRKFLELILADLREAGLLLSQRGKMGGYTLARLSHLISLGDIIRVIEGPLALVPCVSRTAYRRCTDCKSEADCAIRHAMMRVRDETARILDGTSLADATAADLAVA
ncbi:transcriptional regulator, BadM/Rrf2 family [Sphingomonas gellani]|uniref:Transcriptional regulator, BadM/Rrf2 family n=1 Tax=Sphingomonas gellani TaxID=1166340 RepID=A0A1H8BED9_9SPHN|nr:Rrf2 family transcriptional regulator [Sphingomonas gellani]SEM81225.1 transcriptional regulator, BadM/Rrf2 family [Sphingomonas gellani]